VPLELEQRAAPAHATGAVEFVALDDIAPDDAFRLRPDGDVADLATSLGRLGQLAPVELRPWPGAASDGPRWQVVAGFRRLAAVRMLARERVLARLHGALSDDDAWGLALADVLLREPLGRDELAALRDQLAAAGAAPWAEELFEDAMARAPVAPEERERFLAFLAAAPAPLPGPPPAGGGREDEQTAATPIPDLTPTATAAPLAGPPSAVGGSQDEATAAGIPHEVVEMTPDELAADLAARLSALNQDLATALEAWEDLPTEGRQLLVEQARYVAAVLPFMEAK
jgi:ParB/Sulfiredoxin domain